MGLRLKARPNEVTVRGQCGNCGAHTKERMLFDSAYLLPGNPIYLHCSVCPGWRAHEIVALERAE